MSPQETPRLPGCPQSPKRSATAERNAAARPTRKSQAQTCCHLNECCISEEVAAGICESPIEMGNDGLAAPGIYPSPSARTGGLHGTHRGLEDVHIGLLWCYGWCNGLAGITVCSAGEWSPAWRASSKASDSGPPRAQVGWFSCTALREFEVRPNG